MQNHTTMMPKKYRKFITFCQNHNSLMIENIEKKMYLRRCQEKSHHYDAKKIQKILVFLLKSPYCDARKN